MRSWRAATPLGSIACASCVHHLQLLEAALHLHVHCVKVWAPRIGPKMWNPASPSEEEEQRAQ